MNKSEQIIREHAYLIWEQEGRPEGRQQEHWVQAERELDCSAAETVDPKRASSTAPKAQLAKRKRSTGRQPAAPKRKTSKLERA